MKRVKDNAILLAAIGILSAGLLSCGDSTLDDPDEYTAFIADPERGLSKEKVVNDVRLDVRYQPPEYLALKDSKGSGKEYAKLLKEYGNGMSFVIHVDSKEGDEDIMGKGLQGYADYQNRVLLLNFGIKDYVRLKTSDTTLAPVLGTMENTYGLISGRKLLVVFEAKASEVLKGAKEFEIVFADPVFGTGINRFRYRTEDVLQAPRPNV